MQVKRTVTSSQTWEPSALAWAAGLFEGEGYFTSGASQLRTGMNSTDLDVLQSFQRVVGIGTIVEIDSPSFQVRKAQGCKRQWRWHVGGHEGMQAVLAMFWPWLHERRRERAVELIGIWRAARPLREIPHGTLSRYCNRGCRCEPCKAANSAYGRAYRLAHPKSA